MTIYRGAGGSGDATNDATVTAVAAYAAQAATSATNAANSATTSGTSATNSASSASSAAASASAAASSASQAASSQSAAATSATTAANSATSAGSQATVATNQANNAANSATAAATSASTATTKASEAATSASQAATSATNSANSAASALAIYGNTTAMNNAVTSATNSASAAATSASQAAASANSASDSSTQAGISAGQAASSASASANSAANSQAAVGNALALYGSATALQTAVTNAQTSATQSANSATASSASSSAAQTSANSAATSATNASNSATQAANSAASAAAIVTGVASNRPSVRPSLLLDFQYTKQLDPRITFTRSTTATYYDGKTTAMAEQNLLTYSQVFTNAAWSIVSGCSVTSGTDVAPDGTVTAGKLIEGTASAAKYIGQATSCVSGYTYTLSAYAKPAGRDYFGLVIAGKVAHFNVATGAIVSTEGGLTSAIQSVGNGWYRCSVSWLATGTGTSAGLWMSHVAVTSPGSVDTYAGDGISAVLIWGAQLEQRSSMAAYTPTTANPVTNYIPALQTAVSNDARFDHDPVTGESKGLLIEEQRTNLLTYSSEFDNAAWSKLAGTISANSTIAPDGTNTVDTYNGSSSVAYQDIYQPFTSSATTYTFSVYVKSIGTQNLLQLLWGSYQSINYANFDISAGTVTAGTYTNATISSVGNGWYRLSITSSLAAQAGGVNICMIGNTNAARLPTYDGTGKSVYIWGAQLEAGSFPTSYIPTVASQVTRSADSASMTGSNFSSWYRPDQGTIMAISQRPYSAVSGNAGVASLCADYSNIYLLNYYTSTNIEAYVKANGTTVADITASSWSVNTDTKHALGYAVNDFAASFNGSAVGTDTSGALPVGANSLYIGVYQWSTPYYLNGTIKRIAYYPKRLSNTELQGLTS